MTGLISLEYANTLLQKYPSLIFQRVSGDYTLFDYRYKDYRRLEEYRDMRGVIFHRDGELVSLPFHAFLNLGENNAYPESFSGLYSEKQDGSMVQATAFRGEVVVASRSSLTGYVNVRATPLITPPLKEYILAHEDHTFLFELLDPEQQIVLPHENLELVFLAARKKTTGRYSFPEDVPTRINPTHTLTPAVWNDIQETIRSSTGTMEGVVLYTPGGVYKVKTPWYVAAHGIATRDTPLHCIMAWADDSLDDIATTPAMKNNMDKMYEFVDNLEEHTLSMLKRAQPYTTPKEAALALLPTDNPTDAVIFSHVMAAVRGGYLDDTGRVFAAVKEGLTEKQVKGILAQ